jgi:hypothetical protein
LFLLLGLALLALALGPLWLTLSSLPWEKDNIPANNATTQTNSLELREAEADRSFWAPEIQAENSGLTIERLWDSINATTNKLECIAAFLLQEIIVPIWGPVQHLPHGIELLTGTNSGQTLSAPQWRDFVTKFKNDGWQLENIEFRQDQFDPATNSQPAHSRFYFAARLTNPGRTERAMLEGDLTIHWGVKRPQEVAPPVTRLDASRLRLLTRIGEPFFRKIFQETFNAPERSLTIDPLIVYDLDNDGLPEILLPGKNLLYRRMSDGSYKAEPLCEHPLEFITAAVVADFDGDGHLDLLCATAQGLFLFPGSVRGTFDQPSRQVWAANPLLKGAMVLTCGDIDHNGRLDVFLGQYRVPTLGQVLKPHYYDANDGWPAYLLKNDGHGNFTDSTEASGLGTKRWRRTYSASFVDLDNDGSLDLVVVSDFSGLDLYKNDGHGHFTEVTQQWVGESHAFGMATAFADFNVDGRLDLLMIGMPSPTVDRLQHLNLWRSPSPEDRLRRPAMAFGNRLYLAQPGGGFAQTALNDSIARSGWSWGCSAFDFDNDGFPDVYIANGLESNRSVREYESEFWLHNLFIDESIDDVSSSRFLLNRVNNTRGNGWSYGGYEKNRFFLNQHAESFLEIGHLAGVSLEDDSRDVVAADLDGDGRVDLVLTTASIWPHPKQTLQIFQNQVPDAGHWIGFRFHEEGPGKSPVGARVRITYGGHTAVLQIVTGDSHRSQHPNTVHFGIGKTERVETAEVKWSDGRSTSLGRPEPDRYHELRSTER